MGDRNLTSSLCKYLNSGKGFSRQIDALQLNDYTIRM